MRAFLSPLLMTTLLGALSAAAIAQATSPFDGRYAGTFHCGTIPDVTNAPLRVEMVVVIAGGAATYSRPVLSPDGQ